MLPEYTPKNAKLPEDEKLAKANAKLEEMHAEDERKAEEEKKKREEEKEEVGPNQADAAIEAA